MSAGTKERRTYRRRLSSLRNVRTGLADVLRDAEAGTLDPGVGQVLVSGYAVLANLLTREAQFEREQQDRLEQRGLDAVRAPRRHSILTVVPEAS